MQAEVDAIVVGHLCLDIIPGLSDLSGDPSMLWRPGTLHQVGAAVFATGGAVANTGIAMHRLGVKTKLLGKVGDDPMGEIVRGLLGAAGESLGESILVAKGEATSYSIVMSPGGCDRFFLHHPGTNDTFDADDVPDSAFTGGRLLHFGYPPVMRQFVSDGGRQMESLFARAKSQGLTTSLDMVQIDRRSEAARVDWRMWLGRVLPMVDLFLPSLDEISFMLGREASQTDTDVLDFVAGELLGMGPAVIGLKLGDRGLYLRTSSDSQRLGRAAALPVGKHWLDRQLLAPCFAVEVAGTTGSGDCTIAGFLAAILNGLAPEAALNHAVGVGAFCVERPDATSGVPSWKRLEDRLSGPWPRRAVKLAMTGWTWSETSAVWVGPRDPLKEA